MVTTTEIRRNTKLKTPLVSIVMPVYNMSRFLTEAVDSVLKQTYQNWELLMMDDCSTDDSLEIERKYAESDSRIMVFAAVSNQGVAQMRNLGISKAKGECIALFDSDDVWMADKLENQVREYCEEEADIVYCSYDFTDEDGNPINKPFIVPPKTDYRHMLTSSVISCSTALVRADLLKKHPFRDAHYHEDYVLWMELLSDPKVKAVGCQDVMAHYRQVKGSRSNDKGSSARKRWAVYREALGMDVLSSAWAFLQYSVKGVLKYYL